MLRRSNRITAWICALTWIAQSPCFAQPDAVSAVSEQSVKAAYLYKFASYVDWPDERSIGPDTPLLIGVLGAADLAAELSAITVNRSVDGRSILVREIRNADPVDDLDILFVGRIESGRLDRLLAPARTQPILTVTESDDALTEGSIINFVILQNRVRFEISLFEAERSGLRLDSRLLAVAEDVRRTAD
jgi:hypothetical protein